MEARAHLGEVLVTVEGVGKRYRLGEERSGYEMLSHRLSEALHAPFRRRRGESADGDSDDERFWALRDISFDLRRGETQGIIGRNGAGKSTLLKLLSRITLPSEGRVTTIGRIATLLEVGTGFHPELTGRENVFLNGTVLGMRRREIEQRFDEIIEFSGVERFLDTPVKRYSSGMYVRLAFAVAAHLDPEIMLVDEVLAVGDTEFQKKCLGKIRDVSDAGRAVVFVSHNLNAIQRLCSRVLLIESGRVVRDGDPNEVLTEYFDRISPEQTGGTAVIPESVSRSGAGGGRLVRASMENLDGEPITSLRMGQPFRITAEFEIEDEVEALVEVGISTGEGERVLTAFSTDRGSSPFRLSAGTHTIAADLAPTMVPGDYTIDIALQAPGNVSRGTRTPTVDVVERVLRFTALATGEHEEDHWPIWRSPAGKVRPDSSWRLLPSGSERVARP